MDQELVQLIQNTPFLTTGDKSFLLERLGQMTNLDKLRLRSSLLAGQAPPILQSLQMMRAKFYQKELPKKPDILTQITSAILPKKEKKIVAHSILSQMQILGSNIPQPVRGENLKPLQKLEEFYHPGQLSMLNSQHVSFGLNSNTEQIVQNFLERLSQIFDSIENVNIKRSYFMNFVQSQMFASYINTTLTALRHPELQPPKIILNLLYQINPTYLNNKQFQYVAVISNHVRNIVGL